jgi:hypothetical protein
LTICLLQEGIVVDATYESSTFNSEMS